MLIMLSSEEFSSTEELYYESSPVEPLYDYHQESHMRYYENVVYVPHVFSPVMLVEYAPVLYNYLTYEPYLMNRFEVVYVPFLREASVAYLVPYYLQTQEFFSSSTVNEYDIPSNSYPEISLDDVISDDLDDIDSTTSLSDVTSVLSLPRSDSSNSYEQTEFSSSTEESCESLQGFLSSESNDNLNSKCHDQNKSAQEYTEICFTEVDADDGIEAHASDLSLVFVDEEKEPNELDYPRDHLHRISIHEDRHEESDVSSISLSDYTKKPGGLTDLVKVQASSMKNTERGRNISPEKSENDVVFDNDTETCVSNASSLEHVDKCLDRYGLENQEPSPLKHEKIPHELDCTGNYLIPASFHEDHHVESDVLSPSLLTDGEKPGGLPNPAKFEASSSKNIPKDAYYIHISPERRNNHTVFDSDMESCASSSLVYAGRCQDENGLEHGQVLSVKNKKVKTYDSPSSPQMPVWSQGTPLQNPGSLPKIDAMVPDPDDDANSERENDDPTISLRDILASEEYWRLKREEYFQKRRNTQLYRSALEGEIRPRRSLPEVGTLATIFEDLPHPINEPYDDGVELDQESAKDEYFDLPLLEVEKSKSSHTTLLPKKKRFRNTRKFFSGLFRCFKPR